VRDKIGVENRDEFGVGQCESVLQSAGLETGAHLPAYNGNVVAFFPQIRRGLVHKEASLVRAVVKDLDFVPGERVFHGGNSLYDTLGNGLFVIHWKLCDNERVFFFIGNAVEMDHGFPLEIELGNPFPQVEIGEYVTLRTVGKKCKGANDIK
jgi:hypothetical protein